MALSNRGRIRQGDLDTKEGKRRGKLKITCPHNIV